MKRYIKYRKSTHVTTLYIKAVTIWWDTFFFWYSKILQLFNIKCSMSFCGTFLRPFILFDIRSKNIKCLTDIFKTKWLTVTTSGFREMFRWNCINNIILNNGTLINKNYRCWPFENKLRIIFYIRHYSI